MHAALPSLENNITTVSPAQVYAGTAHTTDTSRTDISAVAGRNTRCGAVDGKVECIVISTVDISIYISTI